MLDLNYKYKSTFNFINDLCPFKPNLSIILGSGLGDFSKSVEIIKTIDTSEIPNYPQSTIKGHSGKLHFCKLENKKLLLFEGRIHFYEGYSIDQCLLPVMILNNLGVEYLILTNAAGGINSNFTPGDLMLISDVYFLNLKKELAKVLGVTSVINKNNILNFPSQKLNSILETASIVEGIKLKEGSYWYGKGPSYETPAEIKMLKHFDVDAVGMSTAHEAIYAASLGINVSGISCITNYAAGLKPYKLNHQEVIDTANKVKDDFKRLLRTAISKI